MLSISFLKKHKPLRMDRDTDCLLDLELDIIHGVGRFYTQCDPFVLAGQYVDLHGCPTSDDEDMTVIMIMIISQH